MLRPYNGEYLLQPMGLHLGLNWCSHNCYYCFANLDQPERRGDWAQVARMIHRADAGNIGKSLTVKWLAEKRPIVVSNVSDPFAKSNDAAFQELFKLATDKGHTFAYQTRGGELAKDTLSASRKTSVYISVTSDREDVIKQREPGAPSFQSRMDLIKHAKRLGHAVIVGINPYVPDWWADIDGFVKWLKDTGITRVWVGTLHLANLQSKNMSAKKQTEFAVEITYSKKKVLPDQHRVDHLNDLLVEAGIMVFDGNPTKEGGFWDEVHATGLNTFKTIDDAYAALRATSRENGGKPVAFTEAWFTDFTGVTSDFESSEWGDFVSKSVKNQLEEAGSSRKDIKTAGDFHKLLFAQAPYGGLFDSTHISIAAESASKNARFVMDKNGFSVLVWTPVTSATESVDIGTCHIMR